MIRLIAFDMDGTVLDERKKILPRTKLLLERAAKREIEIVPSTGRPFCGLSEEIADLEGVRYVITSNGAGIYEMETGKCIREESMDLADFLPMLDELESLPVMADPFLKGDSFMSEKKRPLVEQMPVSEELKQYIRTSRTLVPNLTQYLKERGDKVEKLTVNFVENEEGIRRGYDEAWTVMNKYPQFHAVSGGMRNIEVTKSGVTKGSALLWLGEYLGIAAEEMITFGDSGNDIDMLRVAGVGVAMGNAEEEAKKTADYVTDTNDENGVAKALEHFLPELQRSVNPLIGTDYPDPDVIRVGDTYYMVSTTMHFMPGCAILRSYNLIDWELASYVYETLEVTEKQCMKQRQNAYGQGMWAASLRYHKGRYYICFVANDTGKTYLFSSADIMGPWERKEIEGFYHDCSLLFDEEHVYIAYGNRQIYVTELNEEMTAPKKNGIRSLVVEDDPDVSLGYEGTHFYKIDGKYYLFFIHWNNGKKARRTQSCFVSEHVEGPYRGKEVFDTDGGYCNQGVAQGGIVEAPDGSRYAVLFRDSGAIGRIPVLVPVHFEDEFPVFGMNGRIEEIFTTYDSRPGYVYDHVYGGDDFTDDTLKLFWQWNHVPRKEFIKMGGGCLCIQTSEKCDNVTQAPNTLTQRLMYPGSRVTVEIDGKELSDGDVAGLCLLQSDYCYIGIKRKGDSYLLVQEKRNGETKGEMNPQTDTTRPVTVAEMPLVRPFVTVRLKAEFTRMKDMAWFEIFTDDEWQPFGDPQKMRFKLDYFSGVRAGLFCYATRQCGGSAVFREFQHELW